MDSGCCSDSKTTLKSCLRRVQAIILPNKGLGSVLCLVPKTGAVAIHLKFPTYMDMISVLRSSGLKEEFLINIALELSFKWC